MFNGDTDSRNNKDAGDCTRGAVTFQFTDVSFFSRPPGFHVAKPPLEPDPTGTGGSGEFSFLEPDQWGMYSELPGHMQVENVSLSWDCTEGKFRSKTIVK
jgi:hypothetical protein